MIELIILYILNKYDSTIYRISKIADEYFFSNLKTSIGTVSPALKRLENAGCVTHSEKMTEGGLLSKTFSITPEGKKHIRELLLAFESKNPYHITQEAKIALYCSDILGIEEYQEFKNNMLNTLELYKIKLENGLNNSYIELNKIQKATVEITLKEVNELIGLL